MEVNVEKIKTNEKGRLCNIYHEPLSKEWLVKRSQSHV